MSLLITSNTPQNQINTPTQGINLPYSYTNHLQGTLKIPPNSQIAVQSVKINKSGNILLNKYNTQFGFYVGRNPDDAQWDSAIDNPIAPHTADPNSPFSDLENNSLMISTYILDQKQAGNSFSYNTDRIATEIQKAWIKSIYHPNLLENASHHQGGGAGATVVALRNASDQGFSGWDFRLHNASSKPKGALPPDNISASWINAFYGESVPSYSAPTITNVSSNYECFIGTDYPLSLVNGSFNCSFGSHRTTSGKGFAYAEFAIGLTRACLPTATDAQDLPYYYNVTPLNGPSMDAGMSFSNDVDFKGDMYWDWCMASVKTGVGQHTVKLFQNVCPVAGSAGVVHAETHLVEYDYRTPAFPNFLVLETTQHTNVIFNIKNERVSISLQKNALAPDVLVDGESTGGTLGVQNASNMKPTCPTTRFLYPKLLMKPAKTMYIDNYYGVDVKNHAYGTANHIDLWSQSKERDMGDLRIKLRYLDMNLAYDMSDPDSNYNWKIMNTQYGLDDNPPASGAVRITDVLRIVSAPSIKFSMSNSLAILSVFVISLDILKFKQS